MMLLVWSTISLLHLINDVVGVVDYFLAGHSLLPTHYYVQCRPIPRSSFMTEVLVRRDGLHLLEQQGRCISGNRGHMLVVWII